MSKAKTGRHRALKLRQEAEPKKIREIVPLTPAQVAAGDSALDLASALLPPPVEHTTAEANEAEAKNLARHPDYNLLNEQILRLHRSGLSIPSIARRLGSSSAYCNSVVSQDNVLTKEKSSAEAKSLLSRQFSLTATTYTAIQQDQIRRWTVLQATRDRLLGAGVLTPEQLTEGPAKALNEAMDVIAKDFTRTTKEYVDTIQRMGVLGGAAGERDGSHPPLSANSFYADMPVSDKDLGAVLEMTNRQAKLIRKMMKKQEAVVISEAEVVSERVEDEDLGRQ